MVWDGNNHLQEWLPIINWDHAHGFTWHYVIESIILDIKGDITTMLTTLHEVNW